MNPGAVILDRPSDPEAWNSLCRSQGNIIQSTLYALPSEVYGQKPLYIEVRDGNSLLGGVKLHECPPSSKLRFINHFLIQFGEFFFSEGWEEVVRRVLKEVISDYATESKVDWYKASNYYGPRELLIKPPFGMHSFSRYNIAYVDLGLSADVLRDSLHSAHRKSIETAEKKGLLFEEADDIAVLEDLMRKSYGGSDIPDLRVLRYLHSRLEGKLSRVFISRQGERALSAALVLSFGNKAYWAFGGNQRNQLGSGHFLQWKIMEKLKNEGLGQYFLGQVAVGDHVEGDKFSTGISQFKRRFGTREYEGETAHYARNKLKYRFWTSFVRPGVELFRR